MTTTTIPNDTVPGTIGTTEEAVQEEIRSEPPTERLQAEAPVEPQSDEPNHVTVPPITTSNDERQISSIFWKTSKGRRGPTCQGIVPQACHVLFAVRGHT